MSLDSEGGAGRAARPWRSVSTSSAMVSARSPATPNDSSNSHPGTPARSQPQDASSRGAISRFSRPPVRKWSAQAASAAGAWAKYACIAATLALVEVVASSAS